MGNEKTYKVNVLDTTVLIDNPRLPFGLTDGDVVIPVVVLRELDGLKKSSVLSVSRASREVSRFFDEAGGMGDLEKGVRLPTGRLLRFYRYFDEVDVLASAGDNRVLGACLALKREGADVMLCSTDKNMRTAARLLGIGVSDAFRAVDNPSYGDSLNAGRTLRDGYRDRQQGGWLAAFCVGGIGMSALLFFFSGSYPVAVAALIFGVLVFFGTLVVSVYRSVSGKEDFSGCVRGVDKVESLSPKGAWSSPHLNLYDPYKW